MFLIVLDSLGIGALPDADAYGDVGSNTLRSVASSKHLSIPVMQGLGLYSIEGMTPEPNAGGPKGVYGRMGMDAKGKDTIVGHWEIAGVVSSANMPTYPRGFPPEVISKLEEAFAREIICNLPYSGTQVLENYGIEHLVTGALIVYTSADSVLQIAAHEQLVPPEKLYGYCKIAREIMTGEHGVGRIIARPFVGKAGAFTRTENRRDYSLPPPGSTMLDALQGEGLEVIGIGKVGDIMAGRGLSKSIEAHGNAQVMTQIKKLAEQDFKGLCFANMHDFDMLYGHRNDVDGYAKALSEFDGWLGGFLGELRQGDLMMITADHGCDPKHPGTDHTREYLPLLATGPGVKPGNLGTRQSLTDIAATVQEVFGIEKKTARLSFYGALW